MGRWTQYDEDSYRLPEGMKRIGYDADSGRYYFRDRDGSTWVGEEGVEVGEMTRVSTLPASVVQRPEDDVEAGPRPRGDGYQLLSGDHTRPMATTTAPFSHPSPYRTLFPFFLLIAVILLLIWRVVLSPSLFSPTKPKVCAEGTRSYYVQPGESCWDLATASGWDFERFKEVNSKVECEPLMPGTSVCLPVRKELVGWKAVEKISGDGEAKGSRRRRGSLRL